MFRQFRGRFPVCHVLLLVASWLAPRALRREWLQEWMAELWCLTHSRGSSGVAPVAFCLGAFPDAFWLRVDALARQAYKMRHRHHPAHCLLLLAVAALWSGLLTWVVPGAGQLIRRPPVWAHAMVLGLAVLLLPSTTTVSIGYPSLRGRPEGILSQVRWWGFFALKLVLLTAAVFCGTFALGPLLSRSGLQAQATLTGYVLAYRWALNDQRERCPQCLQRLSDPVSIGQPASTLLDWYGTELVCAHGHGVLHVPALVESSYCAPQWIHFDSSWQPLFKEREPA